MVQLWGTGQVDTKVLSRRIGGACPAFPPLLFVSTYERTITLGCEVCQWSFYKKKTRIDANEHEFPHFPASPGERSEYPSVFDEAGSSPDLGL